MVVIMVNKIYTPHTPLKKKSLSITEHATRKILLLLLFHHTRMISGPKLANMWVCALELSHVISMGATSLWTARTR